MDQQSHDEFAAFAQAAALLLGQREGIEFQRDQVAAANPHVAFVTLSGPRADAAVAATEKVFLLLRGLKERHPKITAVRFRKHLFVPTQVNGQVVGVHVVPEEGIVSIEQGPPQP